MIQNLCTILMTTLAVSLAGCQDAENTAPAASNEQTVPESNVAQKEVTNEVVSEELPFIVDDSDLEQITDADQELTIDPSTEAGSLQ